MYVEFLRGLVAWLDALNGASKLMEQADEMQTPYVNRVPVFLEDGLCGFLVDELGGVYSYVEATEADQKWWASRPSANAAQPGADSTEGDGS